MSSDDSSSWMGWVRRNAERVRRSLLVIVNVVIAQVPFLPWPSHHHDLRWRVLLAAGSLPPGGVICALLGFYLPHGGGDEVWLTLTADGGTVRRVRTPYRAAPATLTRQLTGGEAQVIRAELERLKVWSLDHFKRFTYDGWPCAIAITDGKRLHSIQTHNPEGEHRRLIEYILDLVPIPDMDGEVEVNAGRDGR